MDKKDIRNKIIKSQEEIIAGLRKMQTIYKTSSDMDEDNTLDPEDFSHQVESSDSFDNLEQRVLSAEKDLEEFKLLPVSALEDVRPGALVVTDGLVFYIGISTPIFNIENKDYIGIGVDAPIYTVMANKKSGDQFSFADKIYHIENIL